MNIESTFQAIASGELALEQFKIWMKTQLDNVAADTWIDTWIGAYDEGHAAGYKRGYADGRD